jgi:hypothetical protein
LGSQSHVLGAFDVPCCDRPALDPGNHVLSQLRLPFAVAVLLTTLAAVIGAGASPSAQSASAEDATAPALKAPVTLLTATLSITEGTTQADCHASYRPGTPGVATRTVDAPGPGQVDVTLDGSGGDWDLAVFDAEDKLIAADASPDANEVASGWAVEGGELRIQACRRSGDAQDAKVELKQTPLTGDADAARSDPPELVNVLTPTRETKQRLLALDMDLAEGATSDTVAVILHGEADREVLRRAQLRWRVMVPDMIAQDFQARSADARTRAAGGSRVALPSGRTGTYRRLADYNAEMKKLAADNPSFVKLIVLPFKTFIGREVMGLEITKDVQANDGKPAFLNMGVHHSREWPAGEHPMEWAYELINGYKAGNARVVNILEKSRNIVVPIVNPDGFNASREAGAASGGDGGRNEAVPDTAYLVGGAGNGGEYRRKNCRLPDNSEAANCATSAGLAEFGVDPNRNYGGLWGGPGADSGAGPTGLTAQTYRGPSPFSEPETRNIKALVGSNEVTTLITNHTTAGLLLRAPGLAELGDPVDENRGYKALGDAMAKENGYFSQKSFELYDTTGTTEDWTYNTAGGFGFTFEVYCGKPNYNTGDCDDPAFHPLFATQAMEYEGQSDQANHVKDPGFDEDKSPFGTAPGFDGRGNREAYFIAAESTINEARHSVLEGDAPAGVTLRIKKQFKTETFPQPQKEGEDKPILFDDKLEATYTVDSSGKFRWHVNPSTRPIVAKGRGELNPGDPTPPRKSTGGPQGSSETEDGPDDGAAVPSPAPPDTTTTASYNDHPFTIPTDGRPNSSANVRVVWGSPATDWDIELFEDRNGDGKSNAGDKSVGVSAQGATSEEETGVVGTRTAEGKIRLTPGKKYVLRVSNFAAVEPYEVTVTYNAPDPFVAAQRETYTMTCEANGRVLDTQQVFVDRGEVKPVDLGGGCAKSAAGAVAVAAALAEPCVGTAGFASVSVKARGKGAQLGFDRKVNNPVTVSVFQQSVGKRVIGERLVARFTNRSTAFSWNGRANRPHRKVSDGYYFVRYSVAGPNGQADVRRITLERRKGRFIRRPDFYRRASCDQLPSFKLGRPVFGGKTAKPLTAAYRLATPGKVTVTVLKGSKVIKTFAETQRAARTTYRVSLGAKKLKRGEYKVRITTAGDAGSVTSTLVTRRL